MSDPRLDDLPDEVVENASKAYCARCKEQIVAQESMTGTVFVNYYVPALGKRHREFLCGMCGLAFREFIHPELEQNETFQNAKAMLQGRWV